MGQCMGYMVVMVRLGVYIAVTSFAINIQLHTHGELNAKSNLFPLCHFLNGDFAQMKLDNKLISKSKSNLNPQKKFFGAVRKLHMALSWDIRIWLGNFCMVLTSCSECLNEFHHLKGWFVGSPPHREA